MSNRPKTLLFLLLAFVSSAALGAVVYLQAEVPLIEVEETIGSNLGFFLLINLNIIAVMVLGFLVAKNIVKLVLDRRKNILGAKLRSRLISAFVGLSLIPTVLLFLVAKGLVERVLQGWFSPQISSAVDGSMQVARFQYDSQESQAYRYAFHLSNRLSALHDLSAGSLADTGSDAEEVQKRFLSEYLEDVREEHGLLQIDIVRPSGENLLTVEGLEARRQIVTPPPPNLALVAQALRGSILVRPEDSPSGEFIRAYAPVYSSPDQRLLIPHDSMRTPEHVVVITQWILPELSRSLTTVLNAYDDYKELRTYRRPLASSYFLTLVVVTLLIVFAAIWVGFYLSRGLAVPIGLLAKGTQQVAHGNLDYHIPEVGDDELSVLVRSFNKMTSDLKGTTGELVEGRRYMETILQNVGVGVLSLDREGNITTINPAAEEILGLNFNSEASGTINSSEASTIPPAIRERVSEMEAEMRRDGARITIGNITLETLLGTKHIQLTVTKLRNERGLDLGVVVLLDDLTELVSAQRMAAWQEVARRIAHEIKNPLTPIQLSAERVQRRLKTMCPGQEPLKDEERQIIEESTEIIVKQVQNIRTLVNEFSQFARMPKSKLLFDNVNQVIEEAIHLYRNTHRHVNFVIALDPDIPQLQLDREQMLRVFINLIDNAIAAVSEQADAQIEISSKFDTASGIALVSVADNGMGISEQDKTKLFEPYFSTKRGGTGLGLSIVRTIIADHNAFIRVNDVQPRGVRFTIEMPLALQERKAVVGA